MWGSSKGKGGNLNISAGLAAVPVRMRQLLAPGKMLGPDGEKELPLGWEPCPCPCLQHASQALQARNCCSLRKLLLSPAHEGHCWCIACCWHLWDGADVPGCPRLCTWLPTLSSLLQHRNCLHPSLFRLFNGSFQ